MTILIIVENRRATRTDMLVQHLPGKELVAPLAQLVEQVTLNRRFFLGKNHSYRIRYQPWESAIPMWLNEYRLLARASRSQCIES
jgi:hypothetical protein